MAPRRTRRMTSLDRALSIAGQLHNDCSILLELYRKREGFPSSLTVADSRLVSVPPLLALLDNQDKRWCLNSALVQCRGLMDKVISKEEEELGSGEMGDYERQRKVVQERLFFLTDITGKLLESQHDSRLITSSVGPVLEFPSVLFELKLWVYRVFKEIEFWAKTAISTLQALPMEPARARRVLRRTRR